MEPELRLDNRGLSHVMVIFDHFARRLRYAGLDAPPMSDISALERYLHAATRDNTRRAYRAALEHFEVSWGGFLPATGDSVARYLVEQAGVLSTNTLKLRLAALAQWHTSQGFPDPTKAPLVRQVFRGIRALHPAQEKQAEPLQLQQLEHCVAWLEREGQQAHAALDYGRVLRCWRDRALILLGFWRAFRNDELCRLQVEHVQARVGGGKARADRWWWSNRRRSCGRDQRKLAGQIGDHP